MLTANPAGVNDNVLWGNISVTTKEAVDTAVTVVASEFRKYGISSLAEAKPKDRPKIKYEISTVLHALGIYEIVHEWWENQE